MPANFADRLLTGIREKNAPVCVGIDPVYAALPAEFNSSHTQDQGPDLPSAVEAIFEFSRRVIETVSPHVPAVKINSAYFERYYGPGLDAYYRLIHVAKSHGLLVIGDVKRGDVGHTADQYAQAHLADPNLPGLEGIAAPDAVTLNSYLGLDAIQPFLDIGRSQGKGVFVLVRTTNPSSREIQELTTEQECTVSDHVADVVTRWCNESGLMGEAGYSAIGAVVSPKEVSVAKRLRRRLPKSIFLVPGYGAQGAGAEHVAACFDANKQGAIVAASRSIIFAHKTEMYADAFGADWTRCVDQACRDFVTDVRRIVS